MATRSEQMEAIKSIQETIEPTQKTSIFTYHIDPDNNYQTLATIAGTLKWKNGCIFLKSGGD